MSNNIEIPAIVKVIVDIKETLKTSGWVKGAYKSREGEGFCIVGAAERFSMYERHGSEQVSAALNYLHSALCNKQGTIEAWNDKESRTAEEVYAALENAITDFLMMPKDIQEQWDGKTYLTLLPGPGVMTINLAGITKLDLNLTFADSK